MVVKIRYNTAAAPGDPKWRLIINGSEILVADIKILCHSETTEDAVP